MTNLINIDNAPSLMEEKARRFAEEEKREVALSALPKSQEEIVAEVSAVSRELATLSRELKKIRGTLEAKESQFFLLANYKYTLEKKLIEPTIITPKSATTLAREKRALLFQKMMTLSPEQLDKLEEIKL